MTTYCADTEILKQARSIFSATLMIRDRMFRVHVENINKQIRKQGFAELSIPQLHMLMAIRKVKGKDVHVSELADLLGVSPPSASTMVDRLVEKGILLREHSKKDRRKVVVRVSAAAEKDFAEFDKNAMESFVGLIEKIGPDTTNSWCTILEKVKGVIEQEY